MFWLLMRSQKWQFENGLFLQLGLYELEHKQYILQLAVSNIYFKNLFLQHQAYVSKHVTYKKQFRNIMWHTKN